MEITWLGHSCFRLRADELAVITDPFPDSIGLQMGETSAIAVTVSNQHPHHSYWQGVGDISKVLEGPGEYELHGVYVRGVMTPPAEGDLPDQRNTAYLIEMDNLSLCHVGDLIVPLTTRQVEQLTPVDILFLPVGEGCTLKISQAVEVVQTLSPKVVIPMHYALPDLQVEVGSLEPFLTAMGLRDLQAVARLNVTTSSLAQETQVVVLQAQAMRSAS